MSFISVSRCSTPIISSSNPVFSRVISRTCLNNRNYFSRSFRVNSATIRSVTLNSKTQLGVPKNNLIRQIANFSTGSVWQHETQPRPAPGTGIKVHFIKPDGEKVTAEANKGESLLDLARAYDLDLEGACEASLACSTCHVILDDESFNKLEEPTDEENDMLDMAFGLTDTSRLGCQVLMSSELDGLTAKIPSATRNMYVDGAKPKHH